MANAFMTKKKSAIKSGAKSFTHKGADGKTHTYIRSKTKTGMVIFKKK
jgi:hypothetical protein